MKEPIKPASAVQTPAERRQKRSTAMIGLGVIALLWGGGAFAAGGSAGILLALLGIGLLIGGLVIRR